MTNHRLAINRMGECLTDGNVLENVVLTVESKVHKVGTRRLDHLKLLIATQLGQQVWRQRVLDQIDVAFLQLKDPHHRIRQNS